MLYIWDINATENLKLKAPAVLRKSRKNETTASIFRHFIFRSLIFQSLFFKVSFLKLFEAFKNMIILCADSLEYISLYTTMSRY